MPVSADRSCQDIVSRNCDVKVPPISSFEGESFLEKYFRWKDRGMMRSLLHRGIDGSFSVFLPRGLDSFYCDENSRGLIPLLLVGERPHIIDLHRRFFHGGSDCVDGGWTTSEGYRFRVFDTVVPEHFDFYSSGEVERRYLLQLSSSHEIFSW